MKRGVVNGAFVTQFSQWQYQRPFCFALIKTSVDMSWENNTLKQATIRAKYNGTCRLRTKTPVRIMLDGKQVSAMQAKDQLSIFKVVAGKSYHITRQQ